MIDEISYQVFELVESGCSMDDTVQEMLKQYDVDEQEFRNDLEEILSQWEDFGIIEREGIAQPEITQEKLTIPLQSDDIDGMTDLEIYDKMYQSAIQKKAPFKVFFEITHNCNLRCRHCYIQETVRETKNVFLEKEVLFRTFDELKEMGAHEIVITGGECTLHRDFFEIIEYICKKQFKLIILTNGNMIDEQFVERIKDLPIADIRISIYGNEKTHDKMTCFDGSFQKSVKALKMLRKEKAIGTAVILATKDNYAELENLTGFFKENGIEYDFNAFIFPTTEQNMAPTHYRIDQVLDQFVDRYVVNCSGSKCSAGVSRFRVDPYGNVSPCDLLKHEKLGNLYQDSFSKIINSEERSEWIKKMEYIISHNECSKCGDKKFCSCCLGLLYMEHHDYEKKLEFLCKFTEAKKNKFYRIMENTESE